MPSIVDVLEEVKPETLLPEVWHAAEVQQAEVEVLDPRDVSQLFGLQARVARPWLGIMDLRREWVKAQEQWLSEKGSDRTRQAYAAAWEDLLQFLSTDQQCPEYWEITHEHIRAWKADMETRPLAAHIQKARGRERGYAPGTINQYMAAISSFFSYALDRWPVTFPDGSIIPLAQLDARGVRMGGFMNPVRIVGRKKAKGYSAYYLNLEQMQKILKSVNQATLFGARDYALLLMYISTGIRNSEARLLTWGDFEERAGAMWFYWRGKGSGSKENKEGWHEMSTRTWNAIQQYLKLAGRWGHIQKGDFIFTAVTDRAANLANVSEGWNRFGQPLSAGEVNRLVRKYCQRANKRYSAGITVERVHVHTLRHSFAMYLKSKNVSVDDICEALHHENLATTKLYLQQMEGTRAKFVSMLEADLGI
jgi:integrase